jgi:CBS domain-containing protein
MEESAKLVSELMARDVMTRRVLSVRPDWPVEQLADFLVQNSISGAPVTSDSGELIGVVSLTDVARANVLSEEDLGDAARHEYYSHLLDEPYSKRDLEFTSAAEHSQIRVQEIMTPVVLDVGEETPVRDVARKMVESRVHRLFVTNRKHVRGVITALDLMRVISDSL